MTNLEYRIGRMDIDPGRLKFEDSDPYEAIHKFVVEALDRVLSIYITRRSRHKYVAEEFKVRGQIVGGGSCYLNSKNQLVLDDFSGDYEAIPKEVAQRFAELMLPELEKIGVEVKGIAVNPKESSINSYWKN